MDANEKYVLEETTHYYVYDKEQDHCLYDGSSKEEATAILNNLREMHTLRVDNAERTAAGEPLVVELADTIGLSEQM